MNDQRKLVSQQLKLLLPKIDLTPIRTKYRSEGLDLYSGAAKIGRLGIAFATKKFAEGDGLFTMYTVCSMDGGAVIESVKKLNLSFPNFFHVNHFFGFSTLNFRSELFGKSGKIDITAKDNIPAVCEGILKKIQKVYAPPILNIFNGNLHAIDDIFLTPRNYGFPFAYVATICKLNNQENLIPAVTQRAQAANLHDATETRISEILKKLKI